MEITNSFGLIPQRSVVQIYPLLLNRAARPTDCRLVSSGEANRECSQTTRRAKGFLEAEIENDFQEKCRRGAKFAAHTAFFSYTRRDKLFIAFEAVREYVESCDAVVLIGAILTDFSTGAFTAHLDPENTIDIRHHRTQVGTKVYPNVEMKDVLAELARRVEKRNQKPPVQPGSLGPVKGAGSDPITADAL